MSLRQTKSPKVTTKLAGNVSSAHRSSVIGNLIKHGNCINVDSVVEGEQASNCCKLITCFNLYEVQYEIVHVVSSAQPLPSVRPSVFRVLYDFIQRPISGTKSRIPQQMEKCTSKDISHILVSLLRQAVRYSW